MLPKAIAYGIPYHVFMHSTPKRLTEVYRLSDEKKDLEMWTMGIYVQSAVYTAMEHIINGKKATSKYIKQPITQENRQEDNDYSESHEEVAVFEMKQRVKILEMQGLPESPK